MSPMARIWYRLLFLILAAGLRATAGEHPVPLEKNTETAQCLECHEEKGKGAHVHSAIEAGCDTCHEIRNEKSATLVELVSPKDELCFTCHEKPTDGVVHGPYAKGQCVLCHDPHVSDFPNQLRAEGNALCLGCHQNRTIKGNVKLFNSSQELTQSEFQQIPKIDLDPTLRFGHPMGLHWVAEAPDDLHPGKKMSCLTCHENHWSTREELVRTAEYKGKKVDVCDACHSTRDAASMAEAQKRADELEAQRQKEEQSRGKQPSVTPVKIRPPKKKQ